MEEDKIDFDIGTQNEIDSQNVCDGESSVQKDDIKLPDATLDANIPGTPELFNDTDAIAGEAYISKSESAIDLDPDDRYCNNCKQFNAEIEDIKKRLSNLEAKHSNTVDTKISLKKTIPEKRQIHKEYSRVEKLDYLQKALKSYQKFEPKFDIAKIDNRKWPCIYCNRINLSSNMKRHFRDNVVHRNMQPEEVTIYFELIEFANEEFKAKVGYPCTICRPIKYVTSIENHIECFHESVSEAKKERAIYYGKQCWERNNKMVSSGNSKCGRMVIKSPCKNKMPTFSSVSSNSPKMNTCSSSANPICSLRTKDLLEKYHIDISRVLLLKPSNLRGAHDKNVIEIITHLKYFFLKLRQLGFSLNSPNEQSTFDNYYELCAKILEGLNKSGMSGKPWTCQTIKLRLKYLLDFYTYLEKRKYCITGTGTELRSLTARAFTKEVKRVVGGREKETRLLKAQENILTADKFEIILNHEVSKTLANELLTNNINRDNIVAYRGLILVIYSFCLACRASITYNLTCKQFEDRVTHNNNFAMKVEGHKTQATHGFALALIPNEYEALFKAYYELVRPLLVSGSAFTSHRFFVSNRGLAMSGPTVNMAMNRFIKKHLKIKNVHFSHNDVRKGSVVDALADKTGKADFRANCQLLCHSEKTALKFYDTQFKTSILDKASSSLSRYSTMKNLATELVSNESPLVDFYAGDSECHAEISPSHTASVPTAESLPAINSGYEHQTQSLVSGYEHQTQSLVSGYEHQTQSLVSGYEHQTQSLDSGYEHQTQSLVSGYEPESGSLVNVLQIKTEPVKRTGYENDIFSDVEIEKSVGNDDIPIVICISSDDDNDNLNNVSVVTPLTQSSSCVTPLTQSSSCVTHLTQSSSGRKRMSDSSTDIEAELNKLIKKKTKKTPKRHNLSLRLSASSSDESERCEPILSRTPLKKRKIVLEAGSPLKEVPSHIKGRLSENQSTIYLKAFNGSTSKYDLVEYHFWIETFMNFILANNYPRTNDVTSKFTPKYLRTVQKKYKLKNPVNSISSVVRVFTERLNKQGFFKGTLFEKGAKGDEESEEEVLDSN